MRKSYMLFLIIGVIVLSGCNSTVNDSKTLGNTEGNTEITVVENSESVFIKDESSIIEDSEEIIEEVADLGEESDFWTEEQIQEQLGTEYDLNNYTCVASFECGGAKLLAYVEDIENMPTSLVLYCKADKTMDILYTCKDMFTARGYDSTKFADFQNFDNTVFAVESLVVGNCLPVYTWHLTEEGTIVDLADTIDFETQFPGLFTGGIETEDGYKTVIGLREQIPGTTSAGSSQLLPVTLENEKIVKLDMEPVID